MAFSGALTLTDLNDFITPSQACIKPVDQVNAQVKNDAAAASTEIHIDSAGTYYEVAADGLATAKTPSSNRKLEQAQINLNDCLACSGCITSAESVLITLQSHIEVFNVLEANAKVDPSCLSYKLPIISISPQTLASLAAYISVPSAPKVTPRQILRRVRKFCCDVVGFSHVFDTTFARHLALQEHIREFIDRNKHDGSDRQLPMLASACPGWICYAEKTHAEMLPFISRTKSPQQVMGTLVKDWMGQKWHKLPHEIYHVSVMPCYDKKLEASRQDFYNDTYATRDVDCVITTGELELMMREKGFDLSKPVSGELDHDVDQLLPELISHPGSSSGSYLQAILDYIRQTSSEPLDLSVQAMRNADYEEYILRKRGGGDIVFKGAKCYGFRNLQNVVRKVGKENGIRVATGAAGRASAPRRGTALRRNKGVDTPASGGQSSRYDYIEVMACPGGCINGGGQLKSRHIPRVTNGSTTDAEGFSRDWTDSGVAGVNNINEPDDPTSGIAAKWGDKEWTKQVEETYWIDFDTVSSSPATSGLEHSVPSRPDHDRLSSSTPPNFRRSTNEVANKLSRRVLLDLCYGAHHSSNGPHNVQATIDSRAGKSSPLRTCDADSAAIDFDWTIRTMDDGLDGGAISELMPSLIGEYGDEKAEERRRRLFRTQYRAVESEVIGLAVKW